MRALLLLLLTLPAAAEVMDKEPGLLAIWVGAFFAIPIAWLTGRLLPLLGWVVVLPLLPALVALAECYDSQFGPAILREVGPAYAIQAHAAPALTLVAYLIGRYQRRQARP